MNPSAPSVWLHRFAWLTAALTLLLPVTTGAIVTTLKPGMAFADWPSSNGHNMLAYPWLQDGYNLLQNPWMHSVRDQFVEHGHRLSGMTIGLLCLSLIIAAWLLDRRPAVRFVAIGIFLAVVAQGMLGGARVLLDEQLLALLHGDFAALVFSLMATMVLITSKGWESRPRLTSQIESQAGMNAALLLLVCLIAQYVMGGFLRHLRDRGQFAWAWMVHPWFAVVVLFATAMFAFTVMSSESPHVRRCAMALVGLAVAQSVIGLATWYVKYGVPEWGVVAEQDSVAQIAVCSLHKVVGMTTLMTGVLSVFCCWAVRPLNDRRQANVSMNTPIAGVTT